MGGQVRQRGRRLAPAIQVLRDGAVGVDMGKGAVVPVAEGTATRAAAQIAAARREDGNGSSAVVVPARWVTDVLAARVDGLYDGLRVGAVVWTYGGADASGRRGKDGGRERDSIEVCTFCCRRKIS